MKQILNRTQWEDVEELTQIRINTTRIETIENLLERIQGLDTTVVKQELEKIRQINHSNFCRLSDRM
jgi:hypothetical protein